MEKIAIKYFWVINLVTLAAVAYFLASGSSELVTGKLETLLPKPATQGKKVKVRKERTPSKSLLPSNGDDILARNIFDSKEGPISRREEEPFDTDMDDQPVDPSTLPIVPCTDNSVKVLATVASPNDTAWSFASVDTGGTPTLYRVGDQLNDRTVSGITWRYLFLRGSSDECYVDMFADPNQKPKSIARPTDPTQPRSEDDQYANRITKRSDTEAEIDRSLVNELLADPTKFIRSVRVRPYRQGGKTTGYKLRRFQQNSPLALLGAQKGDVIHAVNGVDLTSVDKALGAYQNMRSASDLTFSITRQGKPIELKVSIR